ncbi:hypothetical protein M2322_001830, partial [Rhodoblastus acidophilus]|nr:hypothetical protein [Rhodoblastus acidophilus]
MRNKPTVTYLKFIAIFFELRSLGIGCAWDSSKRYGHCLYLFYDSDLVGFEVLIQLESLILAQ